MAFAQTDRLFRAPINETNREKKKRKTYSTISARADGQSDLMFWWPNWKTQLAPGHQRRPAAASLQSVLKTAKLPSLFLWPMMRELPLRVYLNHYPSRQTSPFSPSVSLQFALPPPLAVHSAQCHATFAACQRGKTFPTPRPRQQLFRAGARAERSHAPPV